MARRFFVGGNFKMNGNMAKIKEIVAHLNDAPLDPNTEVVIAPPSIYLLFAREHLRKGLEVAAQNVFDQPKGAFTGEISVEHLKDANVTWALVGHSERRLLLRETDCFVANKTQCAIAAGIGVILCCGETLQQRDAFRTMEVVLEQLQAVADQVRDWSKVVVAYEPVWAIGTGMVASTRHAQEVHAGIRRWMEAELGCDTAERTRIIYGGSVTEENCADLARQEDIDGFLVGGASLKPAFVDIVNANQMVGRDGQSRAEVTKHSEERGDLGPAGAMKYLEQRDAKSRADFVNHSVERDDWSPAGATKRSEERDDASPAAFTKQSEEREDLTPTEFILKNFAKTPDAATENSDDPDDHSPAGVPVHSDESHGRPDVAKHSADCDDDDSEDTI